MRFNPWTRVKAAVVDRYQRSSLARYGAGLGCDCGDCGDGPWTNVEVPAPRSGNVSPATPSPSGTARA